MVSGRSTLSSAPLVSPLAVLMAGVLEMPAGAVGTQQQVSACRACHQHAVLLCRGPGPALLRSLTGVPAPHQL